MELRGRAFREEFNLFLRIRQYHKDPAPKVGDLQRLTLLAGEM